MRSYQRGFEQNSIVTIVTFVLLYVMVWFALKGEPSHIMFSPLFLVIYFLIMVFRLLMLQYAKETKKHFFITHLLVYSSALFWSLSYSIGLIQQPNLENNLLIIIFLMGIAAAGAIGLSKNNRLTIGFLTFLLLPAAIFSFIYLDNLNIFIGVAFAMYYVYLSMYSKKYYNISQENLKSKLELEFQKRQLEENQGMLTIQNQQLGEALINAKAADKAKSLFLANMSHEIRTPLNGIIGMAHLMEQEEISKEQQYRLSIIQFSAETLVSLVNDILDFSKIEADKLELDLDHFDLFEIIHKIEGLFLVKSQEKGLVFTCDIDTRIPRFIYADQTRIKQIVLNLINNAIKFTEKGQVSLTVSLLSVKNDNLKLRFDIHDTGIGISVENQKKIFSSFTQSDASFTRKFGGTGLGLAISKKIAELMGGEIGVQSELEKGSNFWFTIDVKVGEEQIIEPRKADQLESLNILLAEDNQINVLVAKQVLEKAGHHVITANNGLEAILKFESQQFDLILMDIMMPEMDGLEATWIIRQKEAELNRNLVPIIALSANVVKEDQQKFLEAGMNDFMSKPIHPDILMEKINNLFTKKDS